MIGFQVTAPRKIIGSLRRFVRTCYLHTQGNIWFC
jgi:hypothetical protein